MRGIHAIARVLLFLTLVGAGVAFTVRLWGSSAADLVNSRALLTSEGIIGLAFIFTVCLRFENVPQQSKVPEIHTVILSLFIVVLVFACYLPVLTMPLLHDSYTHVYLAANGSWRAILNSFITHPTAGDFFFRPLGYATFLIDSHWAAMSSLRWHLWNLCIHALNAIFVLLLAKRLRFTAYTSTIAATVFAIHGSRPETVAWVAARFDLLACFFSLLSLLTLQTYVKFRRFGWAGLTLLWTLCAVLSKESAYCLPVVMFVLAFFYSWQDRKHVYRLALLCSALVFLLLLHRFWLLGGPGGYQTQNGGSAVLHFNFLRALNALFFREWSLFFFPVNWSTNVGPLLKFTVLGSILLIAYLAVFIKLLAFGLWHLCCWFSLLRYRYSICY